MKVVHNTIDRKDILVAEWLFEARMLEKEDKEQAIKQYKQIALAYPENENAYNRLMILFRQLKQFKNELYWIDKAIEKFQNRFQKSNPHPNSRIAKLSQIIGHATGLLDKNGKSVFIPEPINKWQKRKAYIQKKMEAKTK